MTSQAHCKRCGRFLSRDDQNANYDHCHKCRQSVFSGQKNSNINTEEKNMKWYNKVFLGFGVVILIVATIFVTRYVMNNNFRVKDLERQLNEATAIVVKGGSGEPKTYYVPEATSVPAIVDSNADTTGKVTEQNYIPHPRRYEETGIEGTKTWKNIVVNDDEYLIVGGVTVDGTNGGVYRGYGPGNYTITINNGFISIVDDDWGDEEFNFRVGQAVEYGWAHAHVDRGPIPE